jgi:DNA-binding CsgD family transcriptional regulator
MGDLEQAQTVLEAWLAAYREYDIPIALRMMRSFLGLIAALFGDYERCRTFVVLVTHANQDNIKDFDADLALAIAALGANDFSEARQLLYEMIDGPPVALASLFVYKLACLPIAAFLTADAGDPTKAVEILALAFSQPPHFIGWMKRWPLLTEFQDELETKLGAANFAAAWERGQKLDLDETIAALRQKFLIENDEQQRANASLNEMLTPRELEVLNLICAGRSNREIAEQYVLAKSTIKRHINHIYGKLGVESRTQALVRARELGLIR